MNTILTCTKNYIGFTKGKQYNAYVLSDRVDIQNDDDVAERFTRFTTYQYFVEVVEHRDEQIQTLLELRAEGEPAKKF